MENLRKMFHIASLKSIDTRPSSQPQKLFIGWALLNDIFGYFGNVGLVYIYNHSIIIM